GLRLLPISAGGRHGPSACVRRQGRTGDAPRRRVRRCGDGAGIAQFLRARRELRRADAGGSRGNRPHARRAARPLVREDRRGAHAFPPVMPAVQETAMGRIVIVAYRPKPGKIEALHALAKQHVDFLRGEGLVTDRVPILMTADDGTVLEVFEWTSKAAMESAHGNAKVL